MEKKQEIDTRAIGHRIREEREKLELSREKFAEIIGLSDYYVGQLERGERQMSLPVLSRVAKCLHVSLDYLVFGKTVHDTYCIQDARNTYKAGEGDRYREINILLNKCSPEELELVKKLIKTILPYTGKN